MWLFKRYDEYHHQENFQLESGLEGRRQDLGSRGAPRRPQIKSNSNINNVDGEEEMYGSKQLSWQLKPQVNNCNSS